MDHPTFDNGFLAFKQLRQPDRLKLSAAGDLVRLPSGITLRITAVDPATGVVHARRKGGAIVSGKLDDTHEVFARVEGELRAGMILEWPSYPEHGLARITDVSPIYGLMLQWGRRVPGHQPQQLSLDPGLWYYAIGGDGHVLYRRERLRRSFADIGDLPPGLTHDWSLTKLGEPFALRTFGAPPSLQYIKRGDLIYIGTARYDAPANHVFVIAGVDPDRGRLKLIMGREHCAQATPCADLWWRPAATDEVRVYKPAKTIARKDLLVWKFEYTDLKVRRGDYTEVLEVLEDRVAVTGVTSTPEVLSFDPARWTPVRSGPQGPIHLRRL